MSSIVKMDEHPRVRVGDGRVVFDGFEEADPSVVELLAGADDPEVAAHACLQIGARATAAAYNSHDALLLAEQFGTRATEAAELVAGAAHRLFDADEGAVPAMLGELKVELAGALGELFDPDSKSSALAAIERVVDARALQHANAMRSALDPENPDSPLGRWKHQVLEVMQEQGGLVLGQLTEMAAAMAAASAQRKALEQSALKGAPFEEYVHGALGALATRYGDLAEHVGRTGGATGALTGDELVRLNPEDTGGRELAVVFESKNRKLSMRKVMEELERSLRNREAAAAVAVFAGADKAPVAVPLAFFGNRAIVVVDPEDPGDRSLELAYMWARWEARKALAAEVNPLEAARIDAAIADARRALGRASTIRRYLGTARTNLKQAGDELDVLAEEVDAALGRVHDELGD